MIPNNQTACKGFLSFPIPKGLETAFSGSMADDLAKLSYLLLMFSVPYDVRRDYGFYIPFPKETGWKYFNKRWPSVRRISEAEYGHIFDWNNSYLNDADKGFPKSVRLVEPYRTGECVLYTTKKKYSPLRHIDFASLDAPSQKLVSDFQHFRLPEIPPDFENPWQALTWASISKSDLYAKRCEYGRFHSNYTSFKHRHMLQYPKGPLAAIDIKAAQMLCVAAVVRRQFGAHKDLTKWLKICREGDIYEHIAAKVGLTRLEAKQGLIRCIFERKHKMVEMPEYQAIQDEFGALAGGIYRIKEEQGYAAVACMCQKLESTILIDRSIPKIQDIPLLTIHDEYILPAKDVEHVKGVVTKEFKAYGIAPRFKETSLGEVA